MKWIAYLTAFNAPQLTPISTKAASVAEGIEMIRLLKGDDTGGTFGRAVQVTIKTPTGASLAGCYAEFIFDGITKTIAAPLVPNEQREIFYSHNETERMALGTRNGTFRVIDSAGKIRTCDNTIPVLVTDRVKSVYLGTSAIEVEIGSAISCSWTDITAKPAWVSPSNEGTANQVLTRTATGSQWTNPPITSEFVTYAFDGISADISHIVSDNNEPKFYVRMKPTFPSGVEYYITIRSASNFFSRRGLEDPDCLTYGSMSYYVDSTLHGVPILFEIEKVNVNIDTVLVWSFAGVSI